MAIFTYLGPTDWGYYSDITGDTVLSHTATRFRYLSTTGFEITLRGTGFTYDANGLPTGGTVQAVDIVKNGVTLGQYSQLATALTHYVTLAFGVAGGAAPNIGGLYALMRSGDDVINGNDFAKTYLGYDGNDTLHGGAASDWFSGGMGVDRFFGGGGSNGIYYDGDAQILHGVSVDLRLAQGSILDDGFGNVETATDIQNIGGSNFDDVIVGSAGLNFLYGHGGNDSIQGGAGNDYVQGGDGSDRAFGGAGTDTFSFTDVGAGHHGATVRLGPGNDVLDDGFGNTDQLTGIENLSGSAFADHFTGDAGDNVFFGNDGNDTLIGGKGNDGLYAGAGNDSVSGGAGFDFVQGDKGVDTLNGGADVDYLIFSSVDASGHGVSVDLTRANGQILDDGYGNAEDALSFDYIVGSAYGDRLIGNTDRSFFWGGAGNDTEYGGAGFDQLGGEAGNDRLYGGTEQDNLTGGVGNDTLTGGAGLDFFYFNDVRPGLDGVDRITDCMAGLDIIVISTAWAADIELGEIAANQYLSGAGVTAATTLTQRLLYDTDTGNLYFDADGTGSGAAHLIATLTNLALLDFHQISGIADASGPI